MNNIEQKFNEYIDKLIAQVVAVVPQVPAPQLKNYFFSVIIDTVIDNLDGEQLTEAEKLNPSSPDFPDKIAEYTATMPDFLSQAEKNLLQAAELVKTSGKLPEETTPA